MLSSLTSEEIGTPTEHRVLHANGYVNTGFVERTRVRFSADSDDDLELTIDDEPLPRQVGNSSSSWVWEPSFFAGTVRCELKHRRANVPVVYLLDVSPDPRKIGQREFASLIKDLLAENPEALLGHEPGTARLGRKAPSAHVGLSYGALVQYANPLFAALEQIRRRPRTRLIATRRTVSLGGVRTVDFYTTVAMARNGSLSYLEAADTPAEAGSPHLLFDVPHSRVSMDAPATRCIVAMMATVISQCNRVAAELEALASKEEVSTTTLSTSLLGRLEVRKARLGAVAAELREQLRSEPFKAVRKPEITAAGLTAVAADPAYAQARQILWKILRPGIGGTPENQWAYMSPTWDIYEQWCLLRVRQALRTIYPEMIWRSQTGSGASEVWLGSGDTGRVELRYQFTAPAWDGERERYFASISKELRPDFVLIVEMDGESRWWTFDAKYSQSRTGVLQAMQAAHVYHDALRLDGSGSRGSFLITPGLDTSLSHLLKEEFQRKFGVGVILCTPNSETETSFGERLKSLLTLAS